MCLHHLREHTQLQADRQYTVYGIVYARQSTSPRTRTSALHGIAIRGQEVDYEVGKTYSACESTMPAGVFCQTVCHGQMYPAGFHRFSCLDDLRAYVDGIEHWGYDAVIAEFTAFGRDAVAQGCMRSCEPYRPVIVWSKVTYVGCVEDRKGPPPEPMRREGPSSLWWSSASFKKVMKGRDTSPPIELVEAAVSPKDYAFVNELEYLGEVIHANEPSSR